MGYADRPPVAPMSRRAGQGWPESVRPSMRYSKHFCVACHYIAASHGAVIVDTTFRTQRMFSHSGHQEPTTNPLHLGNLWHKSNPKKVNRQLN